MMKKLIYLILLFPFLSRAQETQGVRFEDGLSWTAIQAKAKAEHKYIFMDCYTTWCGPCKYMKGTIFPQAEAGAYFNANFISVGVQLDSTDKDDDRVRSWYADGHSIAQQYNVAAYPTFLIFSPDGTAVTRVVGGSQTAQAFIGRVKDGMQPEKQYYSIMDQYKQGRRDTAFLRTALTAATEAYDLTTASQIGNEYLASQKDLYTKENLNLISLITRTSKDKGFAVLANDPARVDKVLGKPGMAEQKVQAIILKEEIYPAFRGTAAPDWTLLQNQVTAKYPQMSDEVIAKSKVIYYQSKNSWTDFQPAIVAYMKKYGARANPEELNDYAWTVFQHCPDMSCVGEALDWSKRSFEYMQIPAFMDTYANILYKMGKKDEAIAMEEKVLTLAPVDEKPNYQQTIDKMKKGDKTWD